MVHFNVAQHPYRTNFSQTFKIAQFIVHDHVAYPVVRKVIGQTFKPNFQFWM